MEGRGRRREEVRGGTRRELNSARIVPNNYAQVQNAAFRLSL